MIDLRVQRLADFSTGKLTSWARYFMELFTGLFFISTVVFSPDFWTINSSSKGCHDFLPQFLQAPSHSKQSRDHSTCNSHRREGKNGSCCSSVAHWGSYLRFFSIWPWPKIHRYRVILCWTNLEKGLTVDDVKELATKTQEVISWLSQRSGH